MELIVAADAPDEPFFMEMNTRLQVEHPVTELVTGLDLVELQLRVAAGERLPLQQSDVTLTGHAVEVRIYAEDPAHDFLPTGGPVLLLREPAGPGVRVDSSLRAGGRVGTTYDPMLSKVIAWAPDRAGALARLDAALADTVLLGCRTNTAFVRALLRHDDVRAGRLDTGLLERALPTLAAGPVPVPALAAAALHRVHRLRDGADPWTALPGWRLSQPAATSWEVLDDDGQRLRLVVTDRHLTVGGREHEVGAEPLPDGLLLTLDGVTRTALVAVDGMTTWVHVDGATWAVTAAGPQQVRGQQAGNDDVVRSPMPGAVVAVHVRTGETVEKGTPLVAVEAMKMEHVLRAPHAGTVEVLVRAGEQVTVGQPLAGVTAGPPEAVQP